MKIRQIHQQIRQQLETAQIDTASLDARLLLQHGLGVSPEEFIAANDRVVSDKKVLDIEKLVQRRLRREPISRIIGRREFWGRDFLLSEDTLDPRPDSETLVEQTLKRLEGKEGHRLTILDLGTGTGCLLLSLLAELPNALGIGVDISRGAIETARQNARNLDLSDRACFTTQSWATPIAGAPFDVVISNPPYIETNQVATLQQEVKDYDPVGALDGGADGLDCYRALVPRMRTWVSEQGFCIFEIGFNQARQVTEIFEEFDCGVEGVYQDLAGQDRCVVARKKAFTKKALTPDSNTVK